MPLPFKDESSPPKPPAPCGASVERDSGPEAGGGRAGDVPGATVAGPEGADPGTFLFRGPTRRCEPQWFTVSCRCGKRHVPMGSCKSEDCTYCKDAVAARRTKRALSRFQGRPKGTKLCYTVFTVPEDVRAYCTRETWRTLRRRLMRVLKMEFAFLFGCESSHPTGDDLEVFKPHINVLWVRRPPQLAKLPRWELARLKRRWSAVLGEVFGRSPLVPDVWHGYKTTRKQVAAVTYYVLRPFPGWSHWSGRRLNWYVGPTFRRSFKAPPFQPEPWRCGECRQTFVVTPASEATALKMDALMFSGTANHFSPANPTYPECHPP